jgi:hypothetical protein
MTPITTKSERISSGDLMDRGVDKLRTVWLALSPDNTGWLDEAHLLSVWATLEGALRDLEPVRDRLQGVDQPPQNEESNAPPRAADQSNLYDVDGFESIGAAANRVVARAAALSGATHMEFVNEGGTWVLHLVFFGSTSIKIATFVDKAAADVFSTYVTANAHPRAKDAPEAPVMGVRKG